MPVNLARLHPLFESKLARFLAVGAANTAFGYTAFAVVYILSDKPNTALIAATIIGILFNFFTTGRIVFGSKTWRKFVPFCAAYGVSYMVNLLLLNSMLSFGVPALVAQAISIPLTIAVSYTINLNIVFRASSTGTAVDSGEH